MENSNSLNHPGEQFKPGSIPGIIALICGICSIASLFLFLAIDGWCFIFSFSLSITSLILAKKQLKIFNGSLYKWARRIGTMSLCLSIAAFLVFAIVATAILLLAKMLF